MAVALYHGLAVEKKGEILLAQGNRQPFLGRWKFPWQVYGGGQGLISDAVNTFQEKMGIAVLVEGFLGIYETPWGKDSSLILILLHGHYQSGEIKFDVQDFSDLRWFSREEFLKLTDKDLYTPTMRKVFDEVLEHKLLPLESIHLIDLLRGTLVH